MTLVDVRGDLMGFYFRLVGTKLEDRGRRGDQGKTLDQIEPAGYRALLAQAYGAAVTRGGSVLHRLEFEQAPGTVWYERVVLPLTLRGETVDALLEGIDWPVTMSQNLADFDPSSLVYTKGH